MENKTYKRLIKLFEKSHYVENNPQFFLLWYSARFGHFDWIEKKTRRSADEK